MHITGKWDAIAELPTVPQQVPRVYDENILIDGAPKG